MVAYSIASRYSANRPHGSSCRVSTVGSGTAIESRQRRPDAGALAGVALIVARVMGKRVGVDTAIRCSRMAARRTGSVSVGNLED
jgi:hypothetical protein